MSDDCRDQGRSFFASVALTLESTIFYSSKEEEEKDLFALVSLTVMSVDYIGGKIKKVMGHSFTPHGKVEYLF